MHPPLLPYLLAAETPKYCIGGVAVLLVHNAMQIHWGDELLQSPTEEK